MSKYAKKFDSNKKEKSLNYAMVSTAFQDHIVKQLQASSLLPGHSLNSSNKKLPKPEAKSKTDSGLKKSNLKTCKKIEIEREYVIDEEGGKSFKHELTLAEKIGLVRVEADGNLDENEWGKVKEKYFEREEFKEPCVICKERMGVVEQVLLSCSHTFHRKCLEAFEKFSGKKSCPMCRKERYQKRVVFDASKHHKNQSAAKIQAAWRGFIVRKWYKNYRKTVPPKDPTLRKKYFEEKMCDITNRIIQSFNYDADNFISNIDRNLEKSREIFRNFDEKFGIINNEKWNELMRRALSRGHDECSICINRLDIPDGLEKEIEKEPVKFDLKSSYPPIMKPIVILSCSHVFHDICLRTFEELNFDKLFSCPECRSTFYKKLELGY